MSRNKKYDYGRIYNIANKNKRIITGVIGATLALVMIIGAIASAFL